MYQVFICYPRTYLPQVVPIHDGLELALRNLYSRDAQVFQDTADLQAGSQWKKRVDTALRDARVLVVVVVPTILDSPQCRREMLEFIRTPGKHIVPLICEKISKLKQMASEKGKHPEGSAEAEIAECADALRTWQTHDFTDVVYGDPESSDYRKAIMELARTVRDTLEAEDQAAGGPDVPPPQTEDTATTGGTTPDAQPDAVPRTAAAPETKAYTFAGSPPEASQDAPPTDQGHAASNSDRKQDDGRSRFPVLIGAAVVAALAAGGGLYWFNQRGGTGYGLFDNSQVETEPTRSLTREEAREALFDRLATRLQQEPVAGVTFDADRGMLVVAAGDSPLEVTVPFGDLLEPILSAGFVPGFADEAQAGAPCIFLGQMGLGTERLEPGERIGVTLDVFDRGSDPVQKTCLPAAERWTRLSYERAVLAETALFSEPSVSSTRLRSIDAGQSVRGPFWQSDAAEGWIRMQRDGRFAYFPASAVRDFR